MIPILTTIGQVLALVLISLVAGAMFGIWRGYDPAGLSPSTFIEMHQGAVRGLNTLLPVMGLATILVVAALAFAAHGRPQIMWLYIIAAILMALAGLITRFGNQPINEVIMGWSGTTFPSDWESVRDTWWRWHLARLTTGFTAELVLIAAIFTDRDF